MNPNQLILAAMLAFVIVATVVALRLGNRATRVPEPLQRWADGQGWRVLRFRRVRSPNPEVRRREDAFEVHVRNKDGAQRRALLRLSPDAWRDHEQMIVRWLGAWSEAKGTV